MSEEKKLALVIEDDPEQQKIFSQAVKLAGFETEVIGNGAEAIRRIDEISPALVILDLHLPDVSGDRILEHIRTKEKGADIPVIVATADPLFADTLNDQSDLVLLKPVSFIQLRDLAIRLRG